MDFAKKHREAIQNRKKREKARRHEEILDAAKKVFLAKGFDRATMDEIALEAAISKPTIYQHFGTKDELYASLLVSFSRQMTEGLEKVHADLVEGRCASGADMIRSLSRSLLAAFETDPEMFRLFMIAQQTRQKKELYRQGAEAIMADANPYQVATDVFVEGMNRGLIRKVDVSHAIAVLGGAFLGILQMAVLRSQRGAENSESEPLYRGLDSTLEFAESMAIETLVV